MKVEYQHMLYITSNLNISMVFNAFSYSHTVELISNEALLHFNRGYHSGSDVLLDLGISEDRGSKLNFSLSSFHEEMPDNDAMFSNDVEPSVQQSTKGLSVFLSSLYSVVIYHSFYIKILTFYFLCDDQKI